MLRALAVPRVCGRFTQVRSLKKSGPFHLRRGWDDWPGVVRTPLGRALDQNFRDLRDLVNQMGPRIFGVEPYCRRRPGDVTGTRESEVAELNYDGNKFELKLDVQHYTPEDLMVKIVDDKLVVSGKHEERADDHGFVARQFTRQFLLPDDIDPDSITSNLSKKGILCIQANTKGASQPNERVINIEEEDTKKI